MPFSDRLAVCLLYMPAVGLVAAWVGQWWALGGYAVGFVALVAWMARGTTQDIAG